MLFLKTLVVMVCATEKRIALYQMWGSLYYNEITKKVLFAILNVSLMLL